MSKLSWRFAHCNSFFLGDLSTFQGLQVLSSAFLSEGVPRPMEANDDRDPGIIGAGVNKWHSDISDRSLIKSLRQSISEQTPQNGNISIVLLPVLCILRSNVSFFSMGRALGKSWNR
jgi:hypothetical protein